MAFTVRCDPEEGSKGGHLGEWARERKIRGGGGRNEEREGREPIWFLYQLCLGSAYIRRENRLGVDHELGREFVPMPPQSSVSIYTTSSPSPLSPLTLQNTP